MVNERRYQEQQSRTTIFPKNRIPFYSSKTSAYLDKKTFESYLAKEISKTTAMARIARNNFLYFISEEQFDTEFKLLGYAEGES